MAQGNFEQFKAPKGVVVFVIIGELLEGARNHVFRGELVVLLEQRDLGLGDNQDHGLHVEGVHEVLGGHDGLLQDVGELFGVDAPFLGGDLGLEGFIIL